MARIVTVNQDDYRLVVKQDGTITLDPAFDGLVYITGKLLVDNDGEMRKNLTVQEDLAVNGGDITSTASEFNLLQENVTTINFGNVATDIQIGADSGFTTVNNNLQVDKNAYLFGHTVFGETGNDSVTFIGDVTSNIVPNASDTYTLGVPNAAWETLYTNKIANEYGKNIALIPQGAGFVDINSAAVVRENLTVDGSARITGDLFTSGRPYGTFPFVPNILYVTTEGSDTNDGTAMDSSRACRTITGALRSPYYRPGTSIRVAPGRYLEDNPLLLKPYTSIIGSDLRTTTIEPINKTQDLFHVTSSTYIAQMQFLNGRSGIVDPMIDRGAYTIAFPNTSFAFAGATVQGQAVITNVQLTEFIPIGSEISSFDGITGQRVFPDGTIVVSIDTATQISVSRKALLTLESASFTTGLLTIYKSPYIQNCTNQSGPWLKDGTMFIPNQTVQVPKLVGRATFSANQETIDVEITQAGQDQNSVPFIPESGMKINTAPQDLSFFHARTLTLANKPFLQEQVVAWIKTQSGGIWEDFDYTPFIQEKCRRDVGIILESILYDACFGGNSKSVAAGLAYYNGVVSVIPGQESKTAASLEHLKDLVSKVIKNEVIQDVIRPELANVVIVEVGEIEARTRQFNCDNTGTILVPGTPLEVSGTLTGTGTIVGYSDPTTYYIDATDGRTTFTLRDGAGVAVDSTAGTTTGLTFAYGLTQIVVDFLGTQGELAETTLANNIDIIIDIIENTPSAAPTVYYSTGPEFGLVCAELLLQDNRMFLQKEVSAYIAATYPFLFFSDINEDICKRDIGYILDTVLADIALGTNYRSLIAGIAYTRSYSLNVTAAQKKQTINVLNIARDLAVTYAEDELTRVAIVDYFKIVTDIINNASDYAAPDLVFSDPLGVDQDLVDSANLLKNNKPFLIAEVTAWIEYQRANAIAPFDNGFELTQDQQHKCARDTGYFIDALTYDLLYGGNSQCVSAANAYFLGAISYIPNQEQQTIAAYTYLQSIISNIVQGILIIPTTGNDNIIQYVYGPAGSVNAGGILQSLLTSVINVLSGQTVVAIAPDITIGVNYDVAGSSIGLIDAAQQDIANLAVEQFKSQRDLKAICERDIGYIVDAVSQDVLLGGNSKSIDAAVTYYNALGFVANSEAVYTAHAFAYAKELALLIVQNSLAAPVAYPLYPYLGSDDLRVVNANSEFAKGAITQAAVAKNFDTIIDIITTGNSRAHVRFQGNALFAATGVSADDIREATSVETVVDLGNNRYRITLSKPTVGIGNNSTLYFGYTDVYPLTDAMVEDRCQEYGINRLAWNQRKYDQYGSMGGMLIDGAVVSDSSPIRSFVADAFTQVNQGGRGVRATRKGYVQLVSVFTIFNSISMQADSGSIMSITNANANFGDYCMISKGYGTKEFSGTVFNPVELPLYPAGRYPTNGTVCIFVPDPANRPHISLIMEVEPPDDYVNVQNKPGFLTATVTTSELIEGSLTIDNIEVFDMYIGQTIYVKDQFGSYVDDQLGEPYLREKTVIVDLGPSTIYLSQPINRGRSEPNNPAFFTIFTCGNAYYTVLTSTQASLPKRSTGEVLQDGDLVLPANQKDQELASISYIKLLMSGIATNRTGLYEPKQSQVPQVVNLVYQTGNGSLSRINELIDITYGIIDAGRSYLADNGIVISKRELVPNIFDTDAAALILLNLDFIAAEIQALMNEYVLANPGFTYNKAKCLRDAKLIARNIAEDLITGGNYNSCYSGLSFYATNGTYHIVSLNDNVRDTGLFRDGMIVNFYQRSYMTASGYLFEYVGAGSNYGALPTVGRADPIQDREVNMLDGGKVFFTSTDQNGDFRIGPGLVIDQAAGVLSGRTFQKSLFAEMTPFILALE